MAAIAREPLQNWLLFRGVTLFYLGRFFDDAKALAKFLDRHDIIFM